jgi:hypothetical protein
MSTIFARCFALGIRLKPEQSKLVGSLVCSRFYRQTTIKHYVTKKEQKEVHGTFQVLYYPPAYTPQIDEELLKFAQNHKIPIKPPKPKKEKTARKRRVISGQKPLYSVKPKNQ